MLRQIVLYLLYMILLIIGYNTLTIKVAISTTDIVAFKIRHMIVNRCLKDNYSYDNLPILKLSNNTSVIHSNQYL